MKRIVLLSLIFPIAAIADDPFACVDPEFTDAFLGSAFTGRPTYSTDLPVVFGNPSVPDSFTLIGGESNSQSHRAIFRSDQRAGPAVSAAVEQISGDQWRELPDIMQMGNGGFRSSAMPTMARLCRDTEPGVMTIHAHETGGQTYVTFSMTNYGLGQTCGALEAQSLGRGFRGPLDFRRDLPDLKLPDDAQTAGIGQGGSGDEYYSGVVVNTAMSRDNLVNFLGDQIREQGWTLDTGWSGNVSAGSVWTKSSVADEAIIGVLHAYGETADTFHVRFGVSSTNVGSFASGTRLTSPGVVPN